MLPENGTVGPIVSHPGRNPGANLKSISHGCHPILVAFVWKLTKETIHLPLGCLQGGVEREPLKREPRAPFLSWAALLHLDIPGASGNTLEKIRFIQHPRKIKVYLTPSKNRRLLQILNVENTKLRGTLTSQALPGNFLLLDYSRAQS